MRLAMLLSTAGVVVAGVAPPSPHQPTTPATRAGQAAAVGQNPLVGTWVANLSKSKQHPNHQFKSATLQFAVDGDTVTLSQGGVNAAGRDQSGTIVLQADGTYEVSADGQTLTATVSGTDRSGAGFSQVIVFDRR